MDEINNTTGTEEFIDDSVGMEMTDSLSDSIDAAWDEAESDSFSEADQQEEETEEEAVEEAEESAEDGEPEQTEEAEQTEDSKPETEEPKADDDWWKSIKVLGEMKEVGSVEEAKALMQKGADYDRIRQERDALKTEKNAGNDFEDFVRELADGAGKTTEEFMEATRVRMLMAKDNSISREKAVETVRSAAQEKKASAELSTKQSNDMADFIREYPNVKGEDIPSEVWNEWGAGKGTLKDLYVAHVVSKQAKADAEAVRRENEQLKAEIAALKDNRKNAAKSTGSVKSTGKKTVDVFDKYWYD